MVLIMSYQPVSVHSCYYFTIGINHGGCEFALSFMLLHDSFVTWLVTPTEFDAVYKW
jgi:hypothetical protein